MINLKTAKVLGAQHHDPAVAAAAGGSGHRLNQRTFLYGCTLGSIASPLPAVAQQPPKSVQIGILSAFSPSAREEAFRQGLRDLGYIGRAT